MNEFELIDEIVHALGRAAAGTWVRLGPGDDSAVTAVPPGAELVSSIDALVADVHFPGAADPELIGYRAMMVSASDLAAMGAGPGFALEFRSGLRPRSEPGRVNRAGAEATAVGRFSRGPALA